MRAILLAAVACGSAPSSSLDVTVDHAPVSIRGVVALALPFDTVTIVASSDPITCDSFGKAELLDKAVVVLEIGPRLRTDGTSVPALRGIAAKGHDRTADLPELGDATFEPHPGGRVRFAVPAGLATDTTSIAGTIDVAVCPLMKGQQTTPATPPADGTGSVTIGGARFPITAAFAKGKFLELELRGGPADCHANPASWDLGVDVLFDGDATAHLLGAAVPGERAGPAGTLALTPPFADITADREVALAGSATLGGYPIRLDGTVHVIACTSTW